MACTAAAARDVLTRLEGQHPEADTELHYRNAFELLVATVLSAQSTDQRVNLVTPALFARYPDAARLAVAPPTEVEALVLQTGFFRQKTKAIIGLAARLVELHGGDVPADMAALTALPGVGRKTANVVLGHAFRVPGLPVDRHVLRVANRIGLVHDDDPESVERRLGELWPPERWTQGSDTLILHGRRVCRPKPLCDRCAVQDVCEYYAHLAGRPRGAGRPTSRTGRTAPGRAARTRTKSPRKTVARPASRTRGKKAR